MYHGGVSGRCRVGSADVRFAATSADGGNVSINRSLGIPSPAALKPFRLKGFAGDFFMQ